MDIDLKLLYKKHNTWIDIVQSFGCNKETAEDIVQEMYYKIKKKLDTGLDISYGEEDYNYYYIFLTLKTLFFDLKKKESKVEFCEVKEINNIISDSLYLNYDIKFEKINKELDKLHWYDKKIYLIIEGGESIAELSRKTHIKYYSLYNTYTKVKDKLKQLL